MAGKVKNSGGLHIGRLVKSVFDASGMTVSEFARRINCERTNVYKIFDRRTIDVELLVRISEILNHNFLADVIEHHGLDSKSVTKLSLNITFDDLTEENVAILSKAFESVKNSLKIGE